VGEPWVPHVGTMGSPTLLEAEKLRDLVPDRDGDDEARKQEQPEDCPEAPARYARRAPMLDLCVTLGTIEAIGAVDGIRIDRRRLRMQPSALCRLGHRDEF
jgi:hypothetical protein